MLATEVPTSGLIVLVGAIAVLAPLLKAAFRRTSVPALIGFLFLGIGLRLVDNSLQFLDDVARAVFAFLGGLGIVALLFRVGLESHLSAMLEKLSIASKVWVVNILVSGAAGFLAARLVLGLALIPSVIVAVAFTATSVGVAVAVWEERDLMKTESGQLLVDIAELDDISGLVLLAVLLGLLPAMRDGNGPQLLDVGGTAGLMLLKLGLFVGACYLFARYLEPYARRFSQRYELRRVGLTLTVAGTGIVIAGLADWLGLSLAVGAFFAGLAFSRDPEAVKTDKSFVYLYEFLTPFFFINIGLQLDLGAMLPALGLGWVLLLAAVIGKVLGAAPLFWSHGPVVAGVIGLSLVPRAEIAMIIMDRGRALGAWAVSDAVYGAMVFVSAATCILAPVLLRVVLERTSASL